VTHPNQDDMAAYALGALEAREERAVADHLAGCPACTEQLRNRLAPAVQVLAESVEQLSPPAELRERLLGIVREEAEAGQVDAAAAASRRPRRTGLPGFLLRPAAGIAALTIVAAGVAGYLLNDDGGGGVSTIPIPEVEAGVGGSLVVADGSATLSAHGLPQLAKGAVYQVWVAQGSSVRPSASFVPGPDGSASAAVSEDLPDGAQVLVTREPRPGLAAPTGPALLRVSVE
jgi:hypothetical protein